MAYCCPKCGSRDIICTEKGYSAGKGLLGIVTFGLVGGFAGFHGSKRLVWRCPRCQGCFNEPATAPDNISETPVEPVLPLMPVKQQQQKKELAHSTSKRPVVKCRLLCSCGAYNSIYDKTCFSCGAEISIAHNKQISAMPVKVIICSCGAKNALTHKYCSVCGSWLDYCKLEQQNGKLTYNQQQCPHCGADTAAKSRKVHFCAHCGKSL